MRSPGGAISDSGLFSGSSVVSTYSLADSAYAGAINDGNFRALSLYKDGTGILTLTGASNYSGVTKVFEGAVRLGSNAGLGSAAGATVVSSGAAVQVSGNIVSSEPFTVAGTGTSATTGVLRNISDTNTLGGAVTLGADSLFGSDAGTLTLGGELTAEEIASVEAWVQPSPIRAELVEALACWFGRCAWVEGGGRGVRPAAQ